MLHQQKNEVSSMACRRNDVVLVTGACGFLGQHVLQQLQKDVTVSEIRGLDKIPFFFDGIKLFVNNLLEIENCREAFKNVDAVIHCAGLVSYDYPADCDELQKNNVDGCCRPKPIVFFYNILFLNMRQFRQCYSDIIRQPMCLQTVTENVIRLCIQENIERLIFCSTTEVTLRSYIKGGIVALVVYQRESKIGLPDNENRLFMGFYAVSKLRAEKKVLEANGELLLNGIKRLKTVAIRPTLLFGPGDKKFISRILKYGKKRGNILPRLAGKGGKQQMTYVGNAAWGLICAKNTLRDRPEAIAGLPVTITDDNRIDDITRFCERITGDCDHPIKRSSWWIPMPISYLIALIIEALGKLAEKIFGRFPIAPTSMLAYMGSVFVYDRARASIHLDYSPIYSPEDSMELSKKYYQSVLNESN